MQRRIIVLTATAVLVGGGAVAVAAAWGNDGHHDDRHRTRARAEYSAGAKSAPQGSRPSIAGPDGRPDGRPGGFGPGRDPITTAASALGISVDDLTAQLRGGASIAKVAAARKAPTGKVVDALVADLTAHFTSPDEIAEHGKAEVDRIVADARRAAEALVAHAGLPAPAVAGAPGGAPGIGFPPGGHHDDGQHDDGQHDDGQHDDGHHDDDQDNRPGV